MSHSPLYSLFGGLMIGGILVVCAVGPARSEDYSRLPWPEERTVVDAACKFDNSEHGIRRAYCVFIYDDDSSDSYWQPVTIKDGVVAVLEEE